MLFFIEKVFVCRMMHAKLGFFRCTSAESTPVMITLKDKLSYFLPFVRAYIFLVCFIFR